MIEDRYLIGSLVLLVLYIGPAYWLITGTTGGQTAAFLFALWSVIVAPAAAITVSYLRWRGDTDE